MASPTRHAPLRSWLRERCDALYDLATRMLDSIAYERFNLPADEQPGRTVAALRQLLDVYVALDFDLRELIASRVLDWYRDWDPSPSGDPIA